jgi:hypothetical protein
MTKTRQRWRRLRRARDLANMSLGGSDDDQDNAISSHPQDAGSVVSFASGARAARGDSDIDDDMDDGGNDPDGATHFLQRQVNVLADSESELSEVPSAPVRAAGKARGRGGAVRGRPAKAAAVVPVAAEAPRRGGRTRS